MFSVGKNSTDIFMTIDAMDILHCCPEIEGIVIMSSDSDFGHLALRFRSEGLEVFGFGKTTSPQAYRESCDHFLYLGLKKAQKGVSQQVAGRIGHKKRVAQDVLLRDKQLISCLTKAVEASSSGELGAKLSVVGHRLKCEWAGGDWSPGNWGYAKLRGLMQATGLFEIYTSEETSSDSGVSYVKIKSDIRLAV